MIIFWAVSGLDWYRCFAWPTGASQGTRRYLLDLLPSCDGDPIGRDSGNGPVLCVELHRDGGPAYIVSGINDFAGFLEGPSARRQERLGDARGARGPHDEPCLDTVVYAAVRGVTEKGGALSHGAATVRSVGSGGHDGALRLTLR